MELSSASPSRSLTHVINRRDHSTNSQGSPHIDYNSLITEPDDPASYFPQSFSPHSQPITPQLGYKEVVRNNVKSLAKLKVDIIISLSSNSGFLFF